MKQLKPDAIISTLKTKDFEILESWGMSKDPFIATKDFSALKAEQRWLINEQKIAYRKYYF